VKEGTFRRESAILIFAVGGVLITAAAIALCTPWFGLVDLREVVITGNRHATAAELVSLSGLRRGQSLLMIPLARIRANLLQHHWVKDVALSRRLPHTLSIRVEERAQVAWGRTPDGACFILGEGGVAVAACEGPAHPLEIRGARWSGSGIGAVLLDRAIVELIEASRSGSLSFLDVVRIDATDPDELELVARSGQRILLGAIDDALSRLNALVALRRSLDIEDYAVIDLRFGGEATLVPR